MTKFSSAYREDEAIPPPAAVRTYLDAQYLAKLPNLDLTNPKLLVVFSGGNAVGKSALSQVIQKELGGLVIENDAIKTTLMSYDSAFEISGDFGSLGNMTWRYSLDLYKRLDDITHNGLIVRDAVIDWYFDRIIPIFEERGYELFIVRYELSRLKRTELIKARGGKAWIMTERLEGLMDDHDIHSKRFLAVYEPDIILSDNDIFDYKKVIDAVRAKLEILSKH